MSLNNNHYVDTGLSKKGFLEVYEITDKVKDDINESINKIKIDVEGRLDRLEEYQNKKWEEMSIFKSTMYETLDKIDKSVVGLEFQNNWKTAMWVCLGSAIPTCAGVAFFILQN